MSEERIQLFRKYLPVFKFFIYFYLLTCILSFIMLGSSEDKQAVTTSIVLGLCSIAGMLINFLIVKLLTYEIKKRESALSQKYEENSNIETPSGYQAYNEFAKKVMENGKCYGLDIETKNNISKTITFIAKGKNGDDSHDISVYFEDPKTIDIIDCPRSITSSDTLNLIYVIAETIFKEKIQLLNGGAIIDLQN